uniref:Uncharacterized protein n=1 Tax=Meloidogyne enterolobii TaxID=390850 RepID=A0A6V7VEL1_MELEN|nr:unnamed protein product [Meloidogyne enterolobii]
MRKYLHDASPDNSAKNITLYSLYAIVFNGRNLLISKSTNYSNWNISRSYTIRDTVHVGVTANTGHFIARVKNLANSDLWQLMDDSQIRMLKLEEVKVCFSFEDAEEFKSGFSPNLSSFWIGFGVLFSSQTF